MGKNEKQKLFGNSVRIEAREIENMMIAIKYARKGVLEAAGREKRIIDGIEYVVREDFARNEFIVSCIAMEVGREDESEIDPERG